MLFCICWMLPLATHCHTHYHYIALYVIQVQKIWLLRKKLNFRGIMWLLLRPFLGQYGASRRPEEEFHMNSILPISWSAFWSSSLSAESHTLCRWSLRAGPLRGLEGSRANTKIGAHNIDCARGVWGQIPLKFWDFTCSDGALRLLFVHAYSTYIPASCHLRLAVSDQEVRRTGP